MILGERHTSIFSGAVRVKYEAAPQLLSFVALVGSPVGTENDAAGSCKEGEG
jgi:hypothetical protein